MSPIATRTVAVSLRADIGDFIGKMGTAGRSAKQFGDELGGLGKKSPKALNDVAFAAGGAGVALLGMAGYAVKTAMDFDKQMSAVSAATKASAADMNDLRAAALQAGKDTIFSATGAAQAQTELAKAGVEVKDILGGGLTGALNLAAAGTMDVGDAAEIAATAMNQFGLSGAQIPHVADLLAAGAGKAQGEVSDMGMALKQSGLVANQFGISIEETTGTLASFASSGLIGSDAGTSFKTMLLALPKPTKQAQKTLDELGISAWDAQGKFVGIKDLAGQLQTKMSGLTQEQRNAALATIFGTDAIRAASILYKQGAGGIQDWTNKVNDQGFAADQAARKTDNLAGDMERLKGSFETLMISAGSGANSGLRVLVQGADAAVSAFSSLPGPVQTVVTVIAGLSGAGLLGAAGLLKVRQTALDAMTALSEMGPMGKKVADGLGAIGSVAGKLGLAGLGIGAVVFGLNELKDWADEKHAPVKANIDDLTDSMKKFADTGKAVGELASKYGDSLQKIGKDVTGLQKAAADLKTTQDLVAQGISSGEGLENWNPIDPQAKQRVTDLDTALSNMVKSGGATQAKLFLDKLVTSGALTNSELAALTGQLPQYSSAAGAAAAGTSGLAQGFGDAAGNARTLAGGLDAAFQAGQSLKQVFDQLNGANLNMAQAQLNAEEATRKLDQALRDSGGSMEITTEKGGAAQQTAINLAKSFGEVLEKMRDQNAQAPELGAAYDTLRAKFIDHIATAGHTRDATNATRQAAEDLANQWFQMPKSVATPVSAPGLPQTRADLAEYSRRLDQTDAQSVSTPVYAPGLAGEAALLDQYRRNLEALNGRSASTYVVTHYRDDGTPSRGFSRVPGERWGGAFEHAAIGKLRDASLYTSTNPGRYMIAEPQTGGEAFVPKYGNRSRSLGILAKAASWYGANISTGGVPAGGASSGPLGGARDVTVNVYPPAGASTGEISARVQRDLGWVVA